MSDFKPKVIALFGDTHCGGRVSIMKPDPIPLDHGDSYTPGPIQRQLWTWYEQFWSRFEQERDAVQERYGDVSSAALCNGDLFEGDHHQTHEIVVRHRHVEGHIARDVLDLPLSLGLDQMFFTRGTASHGGQGAKAEESFAKAMHDKGHPVVENPDVPGHYTAYHWQLDIGPWRLWATHHGSMGQTPRTKASLVALRSADVWIESMLNNWRWEQQGEEPDRIPDMFVGSHYHQFACSPPHMFPTQGIQLPCWTYSNEHAQKVASRTLPDIGGVIVKALPDRKTLDFEPILFKPRRSTPCPI